MDTVAVDVVPVAENVSQLEFPSNDVSIKNEVMVTEHPSDEYNHFLPHSGQNSETTSSPEESPIFVTEISHTPVNNAERQGNGFTRFIGPNRGYHYDVPPRWEFYQEERKYLLIHEPNDRYRIYKDRNRATNNRIYYDCVYCTKSRKCAYIHLDKIDGELVMACCPADDFHVEGCNTMTMEEVDAYISNNPTRRPRRKSGRASYSRSASVSRSFREDSQDDDTEYRRPFRSFSVSPERRPSSRRTSRTDMIAAINNVELQKTPASAPDTPQIGERVAVIFVPDNKNANLVRKYQWNGNRMVCSRCYKNGVEVPLTFENHGIMFAPTISQHVDGCSPFSPGENNLQTAEDYEINDSTLLAGGREYYCPGAKKEVFCCKFCLEHDKITKATVKRVVVLPKDHCAECVNANAQKMEEKMESADEEEETVNDGPELKRSRPEKLLDLSSRSISVSHQIHEIEVPRPSSAVQKRNEPLFRRQRAMSLAPDGFAGGETVESDMWELVSNAGQGHNLLLRDKRNREYGWEFNANPRAVQNAVPYICRLCNITIGRVSKNGDQFILTSSHNCAPIPYVVLRNKYADMARGVFIRKKWWEEQERRYNFKRHSLDSSHPDIPSKRPR